MIVARLRKCSDLIPEGNVLKPRLRAEWVVVREQLCILESFCLSPTRRNSVLVELRVRRLAVIQEEICCTAFCDWCWSGNLMHGRRGKLVCHLRKSGDSNQEMKQEYWVGLYTSQRAHGRELSFVGHHRVKYVGKRNHYCIWHENSESKWIDEWVRYCGHWYQRRTINRDKKFFVSLWR